MLLLAAPIASYWLGAKRQVRVEAWYCRLPLENWTFHREEVRELDYIVIWNRMVYVGNGIEEEDGGKNFLRKIVAESKISCIFANPFDRE